MNQGFRAGKNVSIMDTVTPIVIASSTDATPIEITSLAHSLETGDKIIVIGHTTNTNANGSWTVTKVSATKFTLDDSTATGGGAGGASGHFAKNKGSIAVREWNTQNLFLSSAGTMTLSVRASDQEAEPDFAAAASSSNQWYAQEIVDLSDQTNKANTWAVAGVQKNEGWTVNNIGPRWIGIIPIVFIFGSVTANVQNYTDQ